MTATRNIYKYVSEEYRMMIRNLIDFVLHLHSIGKSPVQLDVSNLCFLNGELRIWGLRFRENDSYSTVNDYGFLHKVTKAIFGLGGFVIGEGATENLPDDFDDLVTMMELYDDSNPPIGNHLALSTAKEKVYLFRNIGDYWHGLTIKAESLHGKALSHTRGTDGWKSLVTWGPMYECLYYRGGHNYRDQGNTKEVNDSLMTFCRNAATHLQPRIAFHIAHSWVIQPIDIECYIMKHFGRALTNFKKQLTINGVVQFYE